MKQVPTNKQLDFLSWEVGMFFHFGIRTFYPGHRDWDGVEMAAEAFDPRELNCRQWLRAAKLIGAKYAIMTTKHHDGFALWPSKYTRYSVSASKWKNGRGDVVREFVDACRAEGLKAGLYYSPAQWGSSAVKFESAKEYDDYFIGQISELLTGYGKIDYLWFDGCGSEGHQYDQKRIVGEIRRLQPEILLFDMWDPDTRWVGNEDGYAPSPNPYAAVMNVLGEQKEVFAPAECDCKLREHWFYDRDEASIKSVDELIGMYEMSVGRGSNLLLNAGPDERGLICEMDEKRLGEFGAEIARRYGHALPFGEIMRCGENAYSIEYSPDTLSRIGDLSRLPEVQSVIVQENLQKGQSVKRFAIYAHLPSLDPISGRRVCVWEGQTIGHKAICRFPAIRTPRLDLEILECDGNAEITSIKGY